MTSEDIMQAEQFQWAWNERPQTRRCIWHVPNGGKRTPVQAAQFKAMGVVAGVSDLHFIWQSQLYVIELKVGANTLSKAQEAYRDAVKAQGAIFYECRSMEKWKMIVDGILEGNPLPGE